MIRFLIDIAVKAMKKQKKSSFEGSAARFKKKIKLQEENLINSLQEQRAKMSALSYYHY